MPFILSAQSGQFYYRNYTTSDGLSYNHIRSIQQDRQGFLWVATWNGLNRFDGYEFKSYYHIPGDSSTLPEFEQSNLVIDQNDRIWIHSKNSLSIYNRGTNTFKTFSVTNESSFKHRKVYGITCDGKRNLWIYGDAGISSFDAGTGKFRNYSWNLTVKDLSSVNNSIGFDNTGLLWVGFQFAFKIAAGKNSTKLIQVRYCRFSLEELLRDWPSFNYAFSGEIYTSSNGNTWLFSNHGLLLYDSIQSRFNEFTGEIPYNELERQRSYMWGGIHGGLYMFSSANSEVEKINTEQSQFPTTYFEDHQGNIWYGFLHSSGQGSGLVRVSRTRNLFENKLTGKDSHGKAMSFFGITKDSEGNLWVGNRNHDHIIKISEDGSIDSVLHLDKAILTKALYPRTIVNDGHGSIWVGYFRSLLIRYNENSRTFSREIYVKDNDTAIQLPNMFRLIYPLNSNRLLIGSNGFLSLYDPATKSIKRIVYDFQPLSLLQTKDGYIWIGGSKGTLLKLEISSKTARIVSIFQTGDDINIESICEIDPVYLWLTTMGSGVIRYDRTTGNVMYFTTQNGLSDNVTYEMLPDKKGNLWVSTNKGLCRFNPSTNSFQSYGREDGILIEEFNADAAFLDKSGKMYFGGVGGIVEFDPAIILESLDDEDNEVLLTDILVSGKPVPGLYHISALSAFTLQKGVNNFQMNLSCTDFRNAERVLYRYRLDGVDDDWILTTSKNRRLSYAGLTPGTYQLRVEATSSGGTWEYSKQIQIIIPPYFYQTNLFRLLMLILVLFIAFLLIRLLIRNTKIKEQRVQDQLKLESLQGQMNPHFIFNSLNSINYFISVSDKWAANQYISGFARLMRAFLNNSASEYIPFEKEKESTEDYLKLEHLRFSDKFDYQISISENLNDSPVEIIPSLTQPFIENAVWHGLRNLENRKGYLSIRYEMYSQDHITCTIEDDGIGRKMASQSKSEEQKQRKSRGIANAFERLAIINSIRKTNCTILISDLNPSQAETGTRVEIQIPVKP